VRARVQRLVERGAQVSLFSVDVGAAREDLAAVLEHIAGSSAPLSGVIHAAGVVDDDLLSTQTPERFRRVMSAKVIGAWNLHALTRSLDLDFFVCLSSVAGALGAAAQGPYGAANTFLDALMLRRRSEGLCGLSIAYGPWDGEGMASRLDGAKRALLMKRGIRFLSPQANVVLFEHLLESGAPGNVCAVGMDWRTYVARRAEVPSFLEGVVEPPSDCTRRPSGRGTHAKPGAMRKQLEEAAPQRRRQMLTEFLCSLIARVLRFPAGETLDPRRGLFDLGIDSLSAVEVRARLEVALAAKLPMTALIDFGTPEALVGYIHDQVLGYEAPAECASSLRLGGSS
jgi:acyl carrier protein